MKDEVDSPRNVAATNRWSCEFSSTQAFPTAVFAGGGLCGAYAASATVKAKKSARKQSASRKKGPSSFPFLDLGSGVDHGERLSLRPKDRRKKSEPGATGIGGSRSSLALDGLPKPSGARANSNKMSAMTGSSNPLEGKKENRNPAVSSDRPKSCPIAIHMKRDLDRDEDHPNSSAEKLYDWATWRMYTRITDHRRRYPIRRYTHEPPPTLHQSPMDNDGDDDDGTVEEDPQECFLEDEVFELEI